MALRHVEVFLSNPCELKTTLIRAVGGVTRVEAGSHLAEEFGFQGEGSLKKRGVGYENGEFWGYCVVLPIGQIVFVIVGEGICGVGLEIPIILE